MNEQDFNNSLNDLQNILKSLKICKKEDALTVFSKIIKDYEENEKWDLIGSFQSDDSLWESQKEYLSKNFVEEGLFGAKLGTELNEPLNEYKMEKSGLIEADFLDSYWQIVDKTISDLEASVNHPSWNLQKKIMTNLFEYALEAVNDENEKVEEE
jgi:hypothetical protein